VEHNRKMPTAPVPARHILSYAQSLRGGGVERVLLRLAEAWLAEGRRVTLVLGSDEGPLAAELPAGIERVVLGSTAHRALRAVPGIVRRRRPDVIFCPGNHYSGIAAWTRARLGRATPPIVAKVSNALRRADQSRAVALGYRGWLRLHPRFIDTLVAMTPAMRDEAIALTGFAPDRVSVIPNPPARYAIDPASPPLPSGRFLLGIGRLEPQKRWDRLIAALSHIAAPGVALVILGEGGERAALERLIASLGVGDRVALPGHALDPRPVIARAEAVVLTSAFEGAPGVLREALALGTPVIATDSSVAVREIVTSPLLGSVVPVDDPGALIAAIDHWLAPGRQRPPPVAEPGVGSAEAYLALFDRLAAARIKA
jgi:glycosyltransferase involved in cell wall biosynthesis